jgi:DNA-binding beta-propeller fold protein YncE
MMMMICETHKVTTAWWLARYKARVTILSYCAIAMFVAAVRAEKLYWVSGTSSGDFKKVQRANLDGSLVEELLVGTYIFPGDIALDLTGGHIYWTDPLNATICRSALDGSNTQVIIGSGLTLPGRIALDLTAGKLYWTDPGARRIQRSNLDGTSVQTLVSGTSIMPLGLALEPISGKMYWTDSFDYVVRRANLNGSNLETIVTGLFEPSSITLDAGLQKIYWLEGNGLPTNGKLSRANLDGSSLEVLISSLTLSPDMALDVPAGKVYWSNPTLNGQIWRANLSDGSQVEAVVTNTPRAGGFAIDAMTQLIYFADNTYHMIRRAQLDGSNIQNLVTGGLATPLGIAVDPETRRIYWTGGGAIYASDLVGNMPAPVLTQLLYPTYLTLHLPLGKVFWTDIIANTIQSANLDGSQIEEIIVSDNPTGIAVDIDNAKIYWTDPGDAIRRANLDGTNIETLVTTELSYPMGIALDVDTNHMYWADHGSNKIQRAKLDGSGIEDVLTGLSSPEGIAIHKSLGKIYWNESESSPNGRIRRADLGGTNIEDIVTGLNAPHWIAITCVPEPYGDVDHSGIVDVGDVLCTLDGFGNVSLCLDGDIAPCNDDGTIDLGDILFVLDAFAGNPPCPDPCL